MSKEVHSYLGASLYFALASNYLFGALVVLQYTLMGIWFHLSFSGRYIEKKKRAHLQKELSSYQNGKEKKKNRG